MYYCHGQGYFHGHLTGTRWKLVRGKTLDAPNGDLWGCNATEWQGKEAEQQPEFFKMETGVETVLPDGAKSTDYTVKEVQKMAKNMTDKELSTFTENDTRKTVQKLT